MNGLRISLISTLLQEARGVAEFMESIRSQTRPPDEVILTDGGSTDGTVEIMRGFQSELPLQLIIMPGCNRSQGRNAAIQRATGDVIAVVDAGCRLDAAWVEKITAPFYRGAEIVAGYYKADPRSLTERAVAAATIPLVDEVKPRNFLPSSRSLAFRRRIWENLGGYPENLRYNEDTAFALALRDADAQFVFEPEAIVHWRPRGGFRSLLAQFYRYALGDGECGFWFPHYTKAYLGVNIFAILASAGAVYPDAWRVLGAMMFAYFARYALRSIRRGAGPVATFLSVAAMATVDIAHLLGYTVGRLRGTFPQGQ